MHMIALLIYISSIIVAGSVIAISYESVWDAKV